MRLRASGFGCEAIGIRCWRKKLSWKLYYRFNLDNRAVLVFGSQTQSQEGREEESETNSKAKDESQEEKSSEPRTDDNAGTDAAS